MKIIPKYQNGGGFDSLFTIYTPTTSGTSRPQSRGSERSKEKDEDTITRKDVLALLKDLNGLPSDMQYLSNKIKSMLTEQTLFGESNLNDLSNTYLSVIMQIQQSKYNKELFNDTKEISKQNNSLQDIAITNSGYLVAVDNKSKKFKYFTPEEWYNEKNSGNYTALTNSNLLWYRQEHPNYAFGNDILTIVENGIGPNKVMELIKSTLMNLGNTQQESEFFNTKSGQQIKQGVEILQQIMNDGPEGVYKINNFTQNQNNQMQAALNYVYQMLPRNAQIRLQFASNNKDIMKGVQDIMINILTSQSTSISKLTADFDSSATKSAGLGVETKKEQQDKTKFGQWSQIQKEEGGVNRLMTTLEGETKYAQNIIAKYYSAFPGLKEGPMSLQDFLSKTGLQHMTSSIEGITFGEAKLTSADMSQIMYDNSGGYIATLPAINENGIKRINISLLSEYSNIIKKLNDNGITEDSPNFREELGKSLKNSGYEGLLDSDGLPNKKYFGQFLVVNGYSTEKVDSIKKYIENVDDYNKQHKDNKKINTVHTVKDPDQSTVDLINTTLGYENLDKPYWFTGGYDIYKAAVFIPLSDNPNDAANADSVDLTLNQSHQNEVMWQTQQKIDNLNSTKTPDDL